MGFFSKLFGKKDETQDLIKMIMENKRRTEDSANYQLSSLALKTAFCDMQFSADSFYDNLETAKHLVQLAVNMCIKRGVRIPDSYKNLPVIFVSNEKGSVFGYIVTFDDARYECECNFVAMMIKGGKKVYYTSEYYSGSKTFRLCTFSDGIRFFGRGNTPTLEEFKKAIGVN